MQYGTTVAVIRPDASYSLHITLANHDQFLLFQRWKAQMSSPNHPDAISILTLNLLREDPHGFKALLLEHLPQPQRKSDHAILFDDEVVLEVYIDEIHSMQAAQCMGMVPIWVRKKLSESHVTVSRMN